MIITLVSAIIIFTIAIINIINLMIYWISQRKREFGIMKALGANNSYIVKWVIIEVISMAVISAFLAIIVQLVILMGFKDILLGNQIYLSISVINCIVAIVVATMCGLIAAVVPAKRAIKVQPVEVVKYE